MQQYGISPERLQENPNLSSFFKILTTSTDKDNKVLNVTISLHYVFHQFMTQFSRIKFQSLFSSPEDSNCGSNNNTRSMSPQCMHTAILWLPFNGIPRYYCNIVQSCLKMLLLISNLAIQANSTVKQCLKMETSWGSYVNRCHQGSLL